MKVKNINGTSNKTCKCGSWIKHWRNFSGQTANQCRASGCSETAPHGAHVQKNVSGNTNWYIVPLCRKHNHVAGLIELLTGTNLVSANVNLTCGG